MEYVVCPYKSLNPILVFGSVRLPAKTLSLMKLYFLGRQVAFVTDVHWVDVLEKTYKRGLVWKTADDFL
jgi:hypothetical protein